MRIKKHIATVMCLVMILCLVNSVPIKAANTSNYSKLDPEIKRGVTLGLTSKKYLNKSTQKVTTMELKKMFTKVMKKRGATSAQVKKWNKVSVGSKKTTATMSDAIMGVYYVCAYMTKGGIPKHNANDNGRITLLGNKMVGKIGGTAKLIPYKYSKKKSYKFYNHDAMFGYDNLVANEHNNVAAASFSLSHASLYSNQYVIPTNLKTGTVNVKKKLTRADAVLIMVRLYDSFEKKASYINISDIGSSEAVSTKEINNAKAVPEVDETGCSDKYIGTFIQYYDLVGMDGTLWCGDGPACRYRETDFKAMADLGMNYVRLQFAINSFAYPAYSKDRTKLNKAIVNDLDNAVKWCLKYGLHVSICFQGYLDDDIDGLGALYPDGTKENDFTPDHLATKESYDLKAQLLKGFAGRYKNVPAKNLSFELQNENTANVAYSVPAGVTSMSADEMADQFIMLAKSIWEISPQRSVSLSTCDELKDDVVPYWEKIADAGINLDYHLYEPRAFIAPDDGRTVSASEMHWPDFKDQNGETWHDMEQVYQAYVEPWRVLAEKKGVNLKLGECGIFIADYSRFSKAPYYQKHVVAWAKDFAKTMQKHGTSYVIGKGVGNSAITSVLKDVPPTSDNFGSYINGAKYVKNKYKVSGYSMTYYINMELAKAAYNKYSE